MVVGATRPSLLATMSRLTSRQGGSAVTRRRLHSPSSTTMLRGVAAATATATPQLMENQHHRVPLTSLSIGEAVSAPNMLIRNATEPQEDLPKATVVTPTAFLDLDYEVGEDDGG